MCKVYDEHKKFANKTNKDLISYNILLLKLMYLVLGCLGIFTGRHYKNTHHLF